MKLLDSNHASILRMPHSARRELLMERMAMTTETIGIPVVVVEEMMRGWLATLAKERDVARQVYAYRELAGLFKFIAKFEVFDFSDTAALKCKELARMKVRISMRDLEIASICLVNNATVLTANRRDFEKVPGLPIENWLD